MSIRKDVLRERIAGYVLIAPAVILFMVIGLFTVLFSFVLSFFHLGQGQMIWNARFAGFDNFKDFLLGDNVILTRFFWQALLNNAWVAIISVFVVVPLSLVLAVLLQNIIRGVKLYRTVFLLPMVTSSVAIFYVWQGIYEPTGALNQMLTAFGLEKWIAVNGWLGELRTALPAVLVTIIWGSVPGNLILFFAGLQTVDPHLYEAAEIDGANAWHKLLHITWPILKPITVIAVIMNLDGALQVFSQIWVMTKGGPAGETMVVNVLIYQEAFQNGDMGRANAMGWTLFLITFVLSLISLRLFRDKTERGEAK
ncbi:carbohydrate ABC transporter permease [Paenibacillus sp. MBLB4367]|uniref:carbohydrate ABC transporter permease n=1 Tax=Paenibacillus sp. MBLB4367 TaxID=3384767 RepID=UPI003907F640